MPNREKNRLYSKLLLRTKPPLISFCTLISIFDISTQLQRQYFAKKIKIERNKQPFKNTFRCHSFIYIFGYSFKALLLSSQIYTIFGIILYFAMYLR